MSMDEDVSYVNANNDGAGAEESNIAYPLSPDLSASKRKRRRRSRKCVNVSLPGFGFHSDSISEVSSIVSQESSGTERFSIFSANKHEAHSDKKTNTTSQRNIVAASTASPNEILLTADINVSSQLISDQDKKLTSEIHCSNTGTTSKFDCEERQEDMGYLEKSPILKSYPSRKKTQRLKKKKILMDKDVSDRFEKSSDSVLLDSSHLHISDSQRHDSSGSNLLPNEYSDLSFSVLEEICQTTELSFNCDTAGHKNSNDNDSSKRKVVSAFCEKRSSKPRNENKNTFCDKLVNANRNVIVKEDNNCDDNSKIKIVVDKRKYNDNKRCGSIYINNSSMCKKLTVNAGSIKTLLQSTKLLDDAESVSYLEETKKQKEFKLMCRKEKLNDGTYISFESIFKGNKSIDNNSRGTLKISDRYENKVSSDKSSLMEKYNIDMNNTLNISSEQLDDLISSAEKSNCCHKRTGRTTSSAITNSKCLNAFHGQKIIPIENYSDSKTFTGCSKCPSNDVSGNKSLELPNYPNNLGRITHFVEPETNKSKSFKSLSRNATLPLKLSRPRTKNESCARNGEKIVSESVVKNVKTNDVELLQECNPTINRKTLNCEKSISTIREMNCNVSDRTLINTTASEYIELMSTSGKSNLEHAAYGTAPVSEEALVKPKKFLSEKNSDDDKFIGFSTAKGKPIDISEEALAQAKTFLSDKDSDNDKFIGFSTAKGKPITVSKEALARAKTFLSDKDSDDDKSIGFSTAKGEPITVSEEALARAKTCLSDKNPDNDEKFIGFSTAKGKPITVSEEALTRAKSFLSDKDSDDDKFIGFSTAKGKPITVSEEALARAKTFLSDKDPYDDEKFIGFSTAKGNPINVSEEALTKAKSFLSDKDPYDDEKFIGFSTAKGNPINVSEEALARAKTFLSDKDADDDEKFIGFSTAKGKPITVSEEALTRAKSFLPDKDSDDAKFIGFSTAKGKPITVSEEALARAKTFLSDKESDDDKFIGFSTAKGKPITVSEEALARAKTFLSDKESDDDKFIGFSTAKGKPITVSEEALTKAKSFLSDKDADDEKFIGFSTAKGKPINVSEEALARAKTFISDKESDDDKFIGFSTAKGKPITVSEEALTKAKSFLSDKDADDEKFIGFSTAKGKPINVSEEALARAKTFISDKDSDDDKFIGFSTAKGKPITVSEEALTRAKTFLSDKDPHDDEKFIGFSSAKGNPINFSEEALARAKTFLSDKDADDDKFIGFSTAKGKPINVSEEALARAKTFISDKDSDDDKFIGFSTAKGKPINVSEEALARAKTFLSDKDSDDDKFLGFSTAKGNQIKVSDEALVKARTLLPDKEPLDTVPNVFSTANGKSILVSDEALNRARTLFQDEESDDHKFCGFSTAKGSKCIQVSEEALSKARSLFSENESDTGVSCGLSSVKGNSIMVSKGALVQARTKLKDESAMNLKNFSPYQISDMCKGESFDASHNHKLENVCHKLESIEEEPCLQDTCIDKHFESQLTPEKNPKSPNPQSQFYEDMPCLSLSFVDEVSESTAAFLADEDISESHNPPVWLKPFVTSPSLIQDRSDALSPILCSDSEVKMRKKRACSPILGPGDRFKKRKKCLVFSKRKLEDTQEAECSTPVRNSKPMKNLEDPYSNFITNLKTSTPISINRTKSKRAIQIDEPNCATEKKLKLMDSWDDSQVDQTIFYQLDVIEGRRKAAEKQELLLKNGKDKSLTKMQKGTLYVKKRLENRIPLKSLVKLPRTMLSSPQLIKEGIKQSVIGVTHENAAEFRFSSSNSLSNEICESNCNGVSVGDNALVILSDDGSAGLKEISRAFLASPGIDPSLISQEWIANHYRLIVWKLASTELSIPHLLAGNYLTLDNLLHQLKYRYDREIDDCQRSCLRKILETDESAARRMILCVSEVSVKKSSATKDVKLTDGWYGINASLDEEMMCMVDRGKVAVGTKLVVQGCELLNCEQGHDPLQVPDTVQLKIHTNSARRAKWDSRLGFCQVQGPILVGKLKDILPKGGNIGRIDVLVVRVYPLVYLLKTESGKTVVYSKKREEHECLLNERKMTEIIEKLQSQVQKEMDEIDSLKFNSKVRRSFTTQDDESLSTQDLVESDQIPSRDQTRIMSNRREQEQRKYQETFRQKLDEKMSENGPGKRNSIPMLKVRVIDSRPINEDKNSTLETAMLTVWKPTEDVESVLAEGNMISLYNITAQGRRSGELQLSTGRQTKYSVGSKSEAFSRVCHFLSDISRSFNPLFSEINTVGLVVHVESSSNSVETAYLTDHENNFLGVRFWGGIKKYGWKSCVCVGSEISCSNLEWRSNVFKCNVPYVFVTELSVFSSNPRSKYLQNALDQFKISLKDMDLSDLLSKSKEKLLEVLNGGETGGNKWNPSSKICSPAASSETNNSTKCAMTSSNKNLITESPMSSIKSKLLLEKMQKLHGYGNPPTITAMPSLQVSPALKKDFKTPSRKSL